VFWLLIAEFVRMIRAETLYFPLVCVLLSCKLVSPADSVAEVLSIKRGSSLWSFS
jgi:hypothetical protein